MTKVKREKSFMVYWISSKTSVVFASSVLKVLQLLKPFVGKTFMICQKSAYIAFVVNSVFILQTDTLVPCKVERFIAALQPYQVISTIWVVASITSLSLPLHLWISTFAV